MRAFGCRMLEFVKGYLHIFWHGDVAGPCSIFPFNGESAEEGTGPADGYGIPFLEVFDEVVCVFFADLLDPKVIRWGLFPGRHAP